MKDGFIKIAAYSPHIKLADPIYNSKLIIESIKRADELGVKLLVLPEQVLTGCSCGDLFYQDTLIRTVENEIRHIISETLEFDVITVFGAPILIDDMVCSCAIIILNGKPIGVVPKLNQQIYNSSTIVFGGYKFSVYNRDTCFALDSMNNFSFCISFDNDLYITNTNNAKIIINVATDPETLMGIELKKSYATAYSAHNKSAFIYCNAGLGESTTDEVFFGHSFICENGVILAENESIIKPELTVSEVDVDMLSFLRRKSEERIFQNNTVFFSAESSFYSETELTRPFSTTPFISLDENYYKRVIEMQAVALMSRLKRINAQSLLIGISGGLDSTLALLACCKACDLMHVNRDFIHAVTMPCFGTTVQTKNNAIELCHLLGVTLHTIPIADIVRSHFADIEHDESVHNSTYENAQARMRTLVLMDMANSLNGPVIGTGDLSELALGWATYNGDHMSMYSINAGIPKTLVKEVVKHCASNASSDELKKCLLSIIATPISPELLPASSDGNISQITEDIVGPYELHDFFIYYTLVKGFGPRKIFRIAQYSFKNIFDRDTILKWLKSFYKRLFSQQYKRNCMPDGVRIGEISLSPRGGFSMPSDASCRIWLNELEKM